GRVVVRDGPPLRLRDGEDAQPERFGEFHLVLLLVTEPALLGPRRAHEVAPRRHQGEAHAQRVHHLHDDRPHSGVKKLIYAFGEVAAPAGGHRPQLAREAEQFGAVGLAVVVEPVGEGEPGHLVGWILAQGGQEGLFVHRLHDGPRRDVIVCDHDITAARSPQRRWPDKTALPLPPSATLASARPPLPSWPLAQLPPSSSLTHTTPRRHVCCCERPVIERLSTQARRSRHMGAKQLVYSDD